MKFTGYGYSLIGSREQNQDSFLVDNENGVFAVADGVGGGYRGDVASQMAVVGFKKYFAQEKNLKIIVEKIQTEILEEAIKAIGEALMGTTFTAIQTEENRVNLIHVGDSHCYWYRENRLDLQNEDHESYDENFGGPVLYSYLGLSPEIQALKIQELSFKVEAGQGFLLCSDGVYKQIDELTLLNIVKTRIGEPEVLVKELCEKASQAEHSDNVTTVWIEIK